MADMLRTGVENSGGDEQVKEETLRILDESKEILDRLESDEARNEYADVRYATIAALNDLRANTHDELDAVRQGLADETINPFNYSEGDISQEELGDITREFSELNQIESEATNPEAPTGRFGSLMLGYIEGTNESILNGGEEALDNEISWYLTAFGSDEGSGALSASTAYLGAQFFLEPSTIQETVSLLLGIKNSGESLETKLFQLSQVLYEVGKEAGAPAGLEAAHNSATRTIIQRVVESDERDIAIGFSEERGYYTTEIIGSTSSELELGTYLCSLNRSGRLTRENLLSPGGPFSPTELFTVLERYKNGEFGGENVRGLFGQYLEDFDQNMQSIIIHTINNSPSPSDISDMVQSGIAVDGEVLNSVLSHCELCSRIDEYSYEDIDSMTDEELEAYAGNENTRPFHEGLMNLTELHEESLGEIESILVAALQDILGQEELPEGILLQLESTTTETFVFMESYFAKNSGSICKVDLTQLMQGDNSPLQNLLTQVRLQQGVSIDTETLNLRIDTALDSIIETGLENEIAQHRVHIEILEGELARLETIPENERSNTQTQMIEGLKAQISDIQTSLRGAERALEREISAAEIRNLNEQQIIELKAYMLEEGLSWPDAIEQVHGTEFDFSNSLLVELFENNPEYIRRIKTQENLLEFLEARTGEPGNEVIRISHIHPNLRGEFAVIRGIGELSQSDINLIPESFFDTDNQAEAYSKLVVLLNNSTGAVRQIMTKFNVHTQGSDNRIQLIYALTDLFDSQDLHQIDQNILDEVARNIDDLRQLDHESVSLLPEGEEEITGVSERDADDRFSSTYTRIMNGTYNMTLEDREIIHNYFTRYGVAEKRMQYLNLLRQDKLEPRTIESTVPYMAKIEYFNDIVYSGIEKFGVEFTELLPHEWHSDPMIIEKTLQSCFTGYENIDHGFGPVRGTLRGEQNSNLVRASNILIIEDAPSLYAAYVGVGEDIELLGKHFWNKFDNEGQLQSIVDNAGEVYTSSFTQDKLPVILEIVTELSRQNNRKQDAINTISALQEVLISPENNNSIRFARNYLEERFSNEERFQPHIERIIRRLEFGFDAEIILDAITPLLAEAGIPNEDVGRFLDEFFIAVSEGASIDRARLGEIGFTENDLGNFPISLLQTSEQEGSYEIGDNVYDGENNPSNAVLIDFIERTSDGDDIHERINMYLTYYNIDSDSRFGVALISFIVSNDTAVRSFATAELAADGALTDAVVRAIQGEQGTYDGLNETITRAINDGEISLADMRSAPEIAQEYGLEVQDDGTIRVIDENHEETMPLPTLLPEDISSPNLSEVYTDISRELNLTEEESQSLTEEELTMIAGSQEVRESFMEFRTTLADLGLSEVWQFRNQIFTAIGSLDFNLNDGDYIGENELNIFLTKTVFATTQDNRLRETPSNLDTTLQIIRTLNHQTGGPSDIDTVNTVGDGLTLLEYSFREQFAPRDNGILMFEFTKFQEALRGNGE